MIYNIPFGVNFCDILAEKLLNETKDNVVSLANYTIIVPTVRASKNLRNSFSHISKNTNLILPKIISLNVFEEDNIELLSGDEIPETLSNIKRAFILSKFILKIKPFDLNKAQSMRLALELGNLFDQIETQQLDIKNLENIVPEEFAEHWQITLTFLNIISEHWQDYLKENNLVSQAQQRNIILNSQRDIWKNTKQNIIIAGFSSTIPAMLDLMKTVHNLENGEIIIQGLDRSLNEEDLTEINYLYGIYEIINHLKAIKYDIKDLLSVKECRQKLTSLMMLPADKTSNWRTSDNDISKDVLQNLEYIECENEQNEAEIISLILRKNLEEKDKTVSLVTPDRNLARCVTSNLTRWGIIANDSSGQPLQHTTIGNWLKLVLNMVVNDFNTIDFFSCLKHPLASLGESKVEFKKYIRKLEKEVRKNKKVIIPNYIKENIGILNNKEQHSFSDFLKQHILLCEKLTSTDKISGEEILWKEEFGKDSANFIHNLFENASEEKITLSEYYSIFSLFIQSEQVRQKYGFHPRLSILGLTESRLAKSDIVILGGLNEGIWPPADNIDGWMSRPMKQDFGMVSPDLNIGLSGFDFANAFNFEKVYLTRAKKQGNSVSIKSRWLNRLDGVLESKKIELIQNNQWQELAKTLNQPKEFLDSVKPSPCPDISVRPKQLSVSDIDVLRKDPYAIYAKKILNLKKMDSLEEDISNATKGTIIHSCLEEFIKQYPEVLPNKPEEKLLNIGREVFKEHLSDDSYYSFWWPKFENIAEWFIKTEKNRREISGYKNLLTESEGFIDISGVKITAKADRIDIGMSGLDIIDYKTGTAPSKAKIESLNYTQLPIEALIASKNGFGNKNNTVSSIAIWSLKGKQNEEDSIVNFPISDEFLDRTEILLDKLINHFNDPRTTYPAEPNFAKSLDYNNYEHLSRLKLWREKNKDY